MKFAFLKNKCVIISLALALTAIIIFVTAQSLKFMADPRFVYFALVADILLACAAAWLICVSLIFFRARLMQAAGIFLAAASLFFLGTDISAVVRTDKDDFTTVIHAGGGGYYNCYELTEKYAEEGCEYIELDFLFTADEELVCSHKFEFLTGGGTL